MVKKIEHVLFCWVDVHRSTLTTNDSNRGVNVRCVT